MRDPLPARRAHETIRFTHWGLSYVVGVGRASEVSPVREVFINCGKSGEQAETLARDSAVLLSLALQHGVPIDAMRHAITRNADGEASGPIGKLLDIVGEASN